MKSGDVILVNDTWSLYLAGSWAPFAGKRRALAIVVGVSCRARPRPELGIRFVLMVIDGVLVDMWDDGRIAKHWEHVS